VSNVRLLGAAEGQPQGGFSVLPRRGHEAPDPRLLSYSDASLLARENFLSKNEGICGTLKTMIVSTCVSLESDFRKMS